MVAAPVSSRDRNHIDLDTDFRFITQLSHVQAAGIQRIRGKSKLIAPRNDACPGNWLFANHQDKGEGRSSVKQSIRETALWKSALEQARPIFIMYTVNSLNNRNFYEFQVGAKVHQ